jgi:hypothetical protein
MPTHSKVSVSLDPTDVEWLRSRARKTKQSVSATIAEAVHLLRQRAAQDAVIEQLGEAAHLSDDDRAALATQWRG